MDIEDQKRLDRIKCLCDIERQNPTSVANIIENIHKLLDKIEHISKHHEVNTMKSNENTCGLFILFLIGCILWVIWILYFISDYVNHVSPILISFTGSGNI